jgi:hypothetical protein
MAAPVTTITITEQLFDQQFNYTEYVSLGTAARKWKNFFRIALGGDRLVCRGKTENLTLTVYYSSIRFRYRIYIIIKEKQHRRHRDRSPRRLLKFGAEKVFTVVRTAL